MSVSNRRISLLSLLLLARSALDRGDTERAGRLWGAVDAENEDGTTLGMDDRLVGFTAPFRAADDRSFADGVEAGRAYSLDDAVALGLAHS